MGTTLLVDGDIIAHRATAAVEQAVDWGDGIWSWFADENEARHRVDHELRKATNHFAAKKILIALSDTENFRKQDVLPSYKSNRTARKPLTFAVIRDYMLTVYNAYIYPRLEADDVLGIWATGSYRSPDTIIFSNDKDLTTIPGRLARSFEGGVETISADQADYNHLKFALAGDPVDGFSGCPGVGQKTAVKLLDLCDNPNQRWKTVVKAYEKKGLTEQDALINARAARILRDGDYDLKTARVNLWTPEESITSSPPA